MSDSLPKVAELNDSNYCCWELEMAAWLRVKGWWSVVLGKLPCPSSPEAGKDASEHRLRWLDANSRAAGAIFLCISEDERHALLSTQLRP
jgi:hypothetical protein